MRLSSHDSAGLHSQYAITDLATTFGFLVMPLQCRPNKSLV
jgi:hypothetical protein